MLVKNICILNYQQLFLAFICLKVQGARLITVTQYIKIPLNFQTTKCTIKILDAKKSKIAINIPYRLMFLSQVMNKQRHRGHPFLVVQTNSNAQSHYSSTIITTLPVLCQSTSRVKNILLSATEFQGYASNIFLTS